MIRKLLIANRGEIACRVIRTARDLGIATVAVYSDADESALHVDMADEAVRIGPAPVAESYLRAEAILGAARAVDADAIHPGYGFLSENPGFVEAVEQADLIFIGPSAEAIRAMGLKDRAKALMEQAGVPVVPGYHGGDQNPEYLAARAEEFGYPVLIKARAGGGGKGMRLVERPEDFAEALAGAQREGRASFGDASCLIEKYISSPRHIEVQVLGDAHGAVVHLFERDCSLQRRHQKVIEEAPAPGMTEEMRAAMGAAAVAAAKAVNYCGAGTVEFIVDGGGPLRPDGFWFMEMNTRLQVEHPVTEAITGQDLVALQIAVAEGAPLPFAQEDLTITGHAFEARLYAEDPCNGFLPATGTLGHLMFGPEVRIDTGVRRGDAVTPHYDPMLAKIIAHGTDRRSALRKLTRALEKTSVAGCVTNRAFLQSLSMDGDFVQGQVDTGLIARRSDVLTSKHDPEPLDYALAALSELRAQDGFGALSNFRHFGPARRLVRFAVGEDVVDVAAALHHNGQCAFSTPHGAAIFHNVVWDAHRVTFDLEGTRRSAIVLDSAEQVLVQREDREVRLGLHRPGGGEEKGAGDAVLAPMPGRVVIVAAQAGQNVEKGADLLVLEAMKMEHRLVAPRAGRIAEVLAVVGDQVAQNAVLIRFETDGATR